MEKQAFISQSPEETAALGEQVAKQLKLGTIICLFGDLGAGKTTFVHGLAKGLKINDSKVHSPTFTLMNVYEGRKISLNHFDFYRLEEVQDISLIGYDEFFYGNDITVVEWPERMKDLLPKKYLKVVIEHKSSTDRKILIETVGYGI